MESRATIIRPDGLTLLAFPFLLNQSPCLNLGSVALHANINMNMLGEWKVNIEIENQHFLTAPFTVVSSAAEIINHPPLPITTAFDPASPSKFDAIFCRVREPIVIKDLDNELVHYRYQWSVNGTMVRDVTIAARSDALAKGQARVGDKITCTVTPTDGKLWGAPTSSEVSVGPAAPKIVLAETAGKVLHILGENLDDGALIFINGEKQKTANQVESPNTRLIGKKAGKYVRPGALIQVRNPDGAVSTAFIY